MIVLGCCCILAAAALYAYNAAQSAKAGESSAALTAQIETLITQQSDAPKETEAGKEESSETDAALDAAKKSGGTETAAAETASDAEAGAAKSVSVGGYDAVGVLSIPALSLQLPILRDWSYDNLKIAPCRYSGTPDGKMIILGHNYIQHFARLHNLKAGDEVTFTAVDGTVARYTVLRLETRDADELNEIITGTDWDLTLFTCTYSGNRRVVVRCVREK